MRLLIDGHNLIGQMPDIRLDDPNDEALLAAKLKTYCMRQHHHCTILFDNGLPGGLSRLSNSQVQVIFAPPGMPADKLLIQRIRKVSDPGSLIVVTADHMIIEAAAQRRVRVILSPDFATMLNAPAKMPVNDEEAKPVVSAAEVEYWLKQFGEAPAAPRHKRRPR